MIKSVCSIGYTHGSCAWVGDSTIDVTLEARINYFENGGDPNVTSTDEYGIWTSCKTFRHNWGFYCMDEEYGLIELMVYASGKRNAKTKTHFGSWRIPRDHKKDILKYVSLLLDNKQEVDEEKVIEVINYYYGYQYRKNWDTLPNWYDRADTDGMTVLMYACQFGMSDAVELLIEKDVDPNIPHPNRETAVYRSIASRKVELLDMFYKAGADLD